MGVERMGVPVVRAKQTLGRGSFYPRETRILLMSDLQSDVVDVVSDELHECTIFSVESNGHNLVLRGRDKDGKEKAVELSLQVCFMSRLLCAKALP